MLVCCLAFEPAVNLHASTIKLRVLHVCFSNSLTGCRPLNSRITSSNDNNCNNTTITTIINRIIIRICMAQLVPSLRHARSLQIRWHFKWHQMTLRCIRQTLSFFPRQMASIWTCISLLAVHAICLMESMAAEAVAIIISSMEVMLTMTPCYSLLENVHRSWINSRIIAKFRRSNRTRKRLCKLHPRAPTLQMAMLMSPSALRHPTTWISKLSSKTAANYWTAWIHSTTTTQIRPINISWSPIKLLIWSKFCMLHELTRTIFWYDFLILTTLNTHLFCLRIYDSDFLYMCIFLLRKNNPRTSSFCTKNETYFL